MITIRFSSKLAFMAAVCSVAASVVASEAASAQSSSTLRDPLIPGSVSSAPFVPAPDGAPPSPGSGPTPAPVVPGMGGPPTLLPWVPAVPSNQIDLGSSGVPMPFGPPVAMPPGVLGPLMTPFVPAPPSTPGGDPGILQVAPNAATFNPAAIQPVAPGGGIPGQGGFNTTIPTVRRGGQETHQWELRGRNSSLIGGLGDGTQDQVTRMGPYAGWGVPFGVPTGDGLRNNSIDLGGGTRFSTGPDGTPISTASTIQDFGDSAMRNSPIQGLGAQQSYEFGQGWRRIPLYSNKSTDYGFPYHQFNPANVMNQKRGQFLNPNAVITNF